MGAVASFPKLGSRACRAGGGFGGFPVVMPKPYIVYFKYKIPTDKTQGAVKQFRVYATTIEEARRLIGRYANYPHIEVLNVKAA